MSDTSDLPPHHLDDIRTKLRSTSMKYHNSEIVYKKVIDQLSKNKNIIIIVIKKYKGCGVVILDRTKYIDKFLPILTAKQFSKLEYDPTSKLQQT